MEQTEQKDQLPAEAAAFERRIVKRAVVVSTAVALIVFIVLFMAVQFFGLLSKKGYEGRLSDLEKKVEKLQGDFEKKTKNIIVN